MWWSYYEILKNKDNKKNNEEGNEKGNSHKENNKDSNEGTITIRKTNEKSHEGTMRKTNEKSHEENLRRIGRGEGWRVPGGQREGWGWGWGWEWGWGWGWGWGHHQNCTMSPEIHLDQRYHRILGYPIILGFKFQTWIMVNPRPKIWILGLTIMDFAKVLGSGILGFKIDPRICNPGSNDLISGLSIPGSKNWSQD